MLIIKSLQTARFRNAVLAQFSCRQKAACRTSCSCAINLIMTIRWFTMMLRCTTNTSNDVNC